LKSLRAVVKGENNIRGRGRDIVISSFVGSSPGGSASRRAKSMFQSQKSSAKTPDLDVRTPDPRGRWEASRQPWL
jgi:hypothetical protein